MPEIRADTIIAQLGGDRFIEIARVRHWIWSDKKRSLGLLLPSAPNDVNSVLITITANGAYKIAFNHMERDGDKIHVREIASRKAKGAEQLREAFAHHTGLEVR